MIPLIRFTLHERKKFLLGWLIGISAIIILLMMVYPSIHKQADQLNATLNQLPEALRALKSNSNDLLSPVGYLNSQLYFATLPLFYGIMAIMLGSSLLSRDEQNHTLELLLARPIQRGKLIAAKALAGVIILCTVAVATCLEIMVFGSLVELDVAFGHIALATAYALLMALSFGAVAFALAATARARSLSIALATIFGFGGYILTSLGGLVDWIRNIAQFFPYHYYDSYGILQGHWPKTLTLYLTCTLLLCTIVSWRGFRRRDIE